jgi:hypothetical protein
MAGIVWAMTYTTFENYPTTQKGNLGETIVDRYFQSKGIISYRPVYDGAHPIDRFVASHDKKQIFIADIKTKARRNRYPDTGIDYNHYYDYDQLRKKYNLRVFLFFVDEMLGELYGNFLDLLEKPYTDPKTKKKYPLWENNGYHNNIVYFPLIHMEKIQKLTEEECESLKKMNTRSYSYI